MGIATLRDPLCPYHGARNLPYKTEGNLILHSVSLQGVFIVMGA